MRRNVPRGVLARSTAVRCGQRGSCGACGGDCEAERVLGTSRLSESGTRRGETVGEQRRQIRRHSAGSCEARFSVRPRAERDRCGMRARDARPARSPTTPAHYCTRRHSIACYALRAGSPSPLRALPIAQGSRGVQDSGTWKAADRMRREGVAGRKVLVYLVPRPGAGGP